MPIHDWTRVDAGTFHAFHNAWITHLQEALNGGVLPPGCYALGEQHAGLGIADTLALHSPDALPQLHNGSGSTAVASPPRLSERRIASPAATYRRARRTLAIRHVSDHRIVALLEIASPANKDRAKSVREFVDKAHAALDQGRHLLVIDLFAPGPGDPNGLNGAIWEDFDPESVTLVEGKPLSVAAYVAATIPEAFIEPLAVGDALPQGPLFLDVGEHVEVPLEDTYQAAYRGMPAYWRNILEAK